MRSWWKVAASESGAVGLVVVQHAAQTRAASGLSCVADMVRLWADELVHHTLLIVLAVIVGDEVVYGSPQRLRRRSSDPGRAPGCCAQISPRWRSGLETVVVASRTLL
jgi:hypothetical protein